MISHFDTDDDSDDDYLIPVDRLDLLEWQILWDRAQKDLASEGPQQRPSIFDARREERKGDRPAPLPCIVFTRTQVLLHNLRAAGYDLSQIAANDNGRLSAALEVVLCRKRGLEDAEEIARAIGMSVDAVRTAVNDLHLAAQAR